MPTITYHRFWCPPCGEWTLFHSGFNSGGDKCKDCGSAINETVLMKDIPREKVIEQRQRYKDSVKNSGVSRLMSFGMSGMDSNPFSEDWPKPEIIEHSAGQQEIDKERSKRIWKEIEDNRKEQAELKLKFGNLGRNDACGCGSGKKFKKCCQQKIKKQYL